MLESLDPRIFEGLRTAGPPAVAVTLVLGVYLLLRARSKRAGGSDAGGAAASGPAHERLAPVCSATAITGAALAADLVLRPRSSMGDVWWPTDAVLRTPHVVVLALALLGLAGLTRPAPAALGVPLRFLLRAGVGVGAVWLTGGFLLDNGVWSPAFFWSVAGATGLAYALGAGALSAVALRSDAPAVHLPSLALLLGGSAGALFLSGSTVGAHTTASAATGVGLLALAALKWRALAQAPAALGVGLAVLLAHAAVPAIVSDPADRLLIATAGTLALLPFALAVHRLTAVRALPGPGWLLPGVMQAGAILMILAVATLFASGGLAIDESSMPWHYGSDTGASSEPYDDYQW